jgi:2-oxoglutarate dehydrogenase E1 component
MNTYSLDYVDDLYVQYTKDPASVPQVWKEYFEEFSLAEQNQIDTSSQTARNGSAAVTGSPSDRGEANEDSMWLARMQDRVNQLVREYRVRGHLIAELDPLGIARQRPGELDPEQHGISAEDMKRSFTCPSLNYFNARTLEDIVEKLRNTYCRSIGAQFTHIDDRSIRDWLQKRMEQTENRMNLSRDVQRRIFSRLADATIFEEFVRKKFVGAKTFSLEGSESLIPLLDRALEKAGNQGVKAVVMGMAHRGRLNVLANIMKKRAQSIFWSFDDPNPDSHRGRGDVRYHLGYSSDWTTSSGAKVHISLCFNPSHLEFVNPVALGRCRAKQDRANDLNRDEHMTILIHGDAAFAGEGVVQETLNLSELTGYCTGGTLHVVINNQVGFTTDIEEGRSSIYATDVAKMLQIPIFHVNGEDPEAVTQVVSLAMDFRKQFQRDVVIDMYAYRKLGHNEGDEPRYTQPLMYKAIDAEKSVKEDYSERLFEMGGLTKEEAQEIEAERFAKLSDEFEAAKTEAYKSDSQSMTGAWEGYFGGNEAEGSFVDTGVSQIVLKDALRKLCDLPGTFNLHKKLKRFIELRLEMAKGNRPLDWATAESLAFATILLEGSPVRLSGQDVQRGTFSQRHAVMHDTEDNTRFMPLSNMSPTQGRIDIINSPLSEAGVLGFEYGYSLDCPEGLVAWEAQFGDFWNVAQPIVDQFITSAEDKWNRLCRLVMLLPHGFEGQGPEHCSARLERFLLLAAEHNVQVTQPTTPAQYFHLLRKQVHSKWSKPLIVLTPKSLLRHAECVSELAEFETGQFQKMLPDTEIAPAQTQRIIMCAGKAYYELLEERRERKIDSVALVRIEQYYPLSTQEILDVLSKYPAGSELIWYQEEPSNMGAWQHFKVHHFDQLNQTFPMRLISRVESASPSTGSAVTHKIEQGELREEAFSGLN